MGKFRNLPPLFAACFLFLYLLTTPCPAYPQDSGASLTAAAPQDSGARLKCLRFSSLAELITAIGDDAAPVFRGFYSPDEVEVTPFAVISNYKVRKRSMLGLTLADQMTAMINAEPGESFFWHGKFPQKMEGSIEEVDGFLRVHIIGRNASGDCRSHVLNIEMSAPIYRFLHSYAESY